MKVGIINYGMGNLYSVSSTVKYLGVTDVEYVLTPDVLTHCDKIILPGVGSFKKAMDQLSDTGLGQGVIEYAKTLHRPVLGICLGMQLLTNSSTESGFTEGLSLIDGHVEKFQDGNVRIPHVGFNDISFSKESILFKNFDLENPDFYFTHSYRVCSINDALSAFCNYGGEFIAAFEKDNIFGTQFHPELSQFNGLKILKNFLEI